MTNEQRVKQTDIPRSRTVNVTVVLGSRIPQYYR